MQFTGFPVAGLDFYDDLEVDNTKSFWEAHKDVYAEAVRAPMQALCGALEPEFGAAKILRPYRDVRFAKDKTPYKTHQGAFVAAGPSMGWYVELSPRGVRVGAGFYEAAGERLAAIRDAIDDAKSGPALRRTLTRLEKDGFEIGVTHTKDAVAVAELLLSNENVEPCGLGARDSLRLEAGLCLYGNDPDDTVNPVEGTLLWTIFILCLVLPLQLSGIISILHEAHDTICGGESLPVSGVLKFTSLCRVAHR